MNEFNRNFLNPYLFLHLQCAFASEIVDERGKIRKVYATYRTPCEKLLSIPDVERFLKPCVAAESLRARMMEKTHLSPRRGKCRKRRDDYSLKFAAAWYTDFSAIYGLENTPPRCRLDDKGILLCPIM